MDFHLEPIKVTYLGHTVWVHAPTPRDYFAVAVHLAKEQETENTENLPEREKLARIGMLLAMRCARNGPEPTSELLFPDLKTAENTCPLELCQLLASALNSFPMEVSKVKNA